MLEVSNKLEKIQMNEINVEIKYREEITIYDLREKKFPS